MKGTRKEERSRQILNVGNRVKQAEGEGYHTGWRVEK